MMGHWTPRHLRKKFAKKSGASGDDKKRTFRKIATKSKRFIKLGYNALQKPSVAPAYAEWSDRARRGTLRA